MTSIPDGSPDTGLATFYRGYLDCLNRQDWPALGEFVAGNVVHNGRPFGLEGYRAMLVEDFQAIPDLRFGAALLVCEPPYIAARLAFDCTPRGGFLGLPVNGRRVTFAENILYEVRAGRIAEAWSIIDRAAIEAQLA